MFTNAILPQTTGAGSFKRLLGSCSTMVLFLAELVDHEDPVDVGAVARLRPGVAHEQGQVVASMELTMQSPDQRGLGGKPEAHGILAEQHLRLEHRSRIDRESETLGPCRKNVQV